MVGCVPRPHGADGGDERVKGVAPAVAHDDPTVCPGDPDVPGHACEDDPPGAQAFSRDPPAVGWM
jgi:hypothetical protein